MADIDDPLTKLLDRSEKDDQDKRIETLVKVMSALYDKAATYTNIIMAADYAGFFAVWSNMKSYMSPTEMRVSALCMVFSLLVFVFWEVTKMILTSRNLHRLFEVLQGPPDEFDALFKKQQHEEKMFNLGFLRAWRVVLFSTIFPAILASGVLVYSFISHL